MPRKANGGDVAGAFNLETGNELLKNKIVRKLPGIGYFCTIIKIQY